MFDVSAALGLVAQPVQLKATGPDTYDADGNLVVGAETTTAISATIQPAQGRQLMDLPEGIRTEARYLIWTSHALATNQVVEASGQSYRILFVWPRTAGGFTRAALGLLA